MVQRSEVAALVELSGVHRSTLMRKLSSSLSVCAGVAGMSFGVHGGSGLANVEFGAWASSSR